MFLRVVLILVLVVVICWALGLTLRGFRRLPGTRRRNQVGRR